MPFVGPNCVIKVLNFVDISDSSKIHISLAYSLLERFCKWFLLTPMLRSGSKILDLFFLDVCLLFHIPSNHKIVHSWVPFLKRKWGYS